MSRERLRKILESEGDQRLPSGLRGNGLPNAGGLRIPLRPTPENVLRERGINDELPDGAVRGDGASRVAETGFAEAPVSALNLPRRGRIELPQDNPAEILPRTENPDARSPEKLPREGGREDLSGLHLNFQGASLDASLGQGFRQTQPLSPGGRPERGRQAAQTVNAALPEGVNPEKLSVGQWMTVLNGTYAEHQPPRERFDAVSSVLDQAPEALRPELRARFMTAQNPNSTQTKRLIETLRERDAEKLVLQQESQTPDALPGARFRLPRQRPELKTQFDLEKSPDTPDAVQQPDERGGVHTEVKRGKTVRPPSVKGTVPTRRPRTKPEASKLKSAKHTAKSSAKHGKTKTAPTKHPATTLEPPKLGLRSPARRTPNAFSADLKPGQITLKRPPLEGVKERDRQQIEKELKRSQDIANGFMGRMGGRKLHLETLGAKLPTGIRKAAKSATDRIQKAGQQQRAAVNTRITQLIGHARAQANSSVAQVTSKANSSKAAIKRLSQTLQQQLKDQHQQTLKALEAKRNPQREVIATTYEGKRGDFEAAGTAVGAKAPPKGDAKAQEYLARPTPEDQDSWLFMGVREKDQNKARADAAHQVGDSYAKGFPEEALKQFDKMKSGGEEGYGVEHDFNQLEELIFHPFRDQADTLQNSTLDALKTSETQALESVSQSQQQFTQSIQQRLQSTLEQLGNQRGSLTQTIDSLTQKRSAGVNQQADASIEKLNAQLRTLAQGLQTTMDGVGAKLRGQQAPKPQELQKVLKRIEQQVDAAIKKQTAALQRGAQTSAKQLGQQATQATQQINQTAQDGLRGAQNSEAQLIQAVLGFAQTAAQTFAQLEQAHQQGAQKHLDSAKGAYTQMLAGADEALGHVPGELQKKLDAAITSLTAGLEQSLAGLDGIISTEAEKAAAQVPPRWKGLLKILLVIAVLIVVALIAGPAVIAAASTLLGSGLLGAIVGGAILGAASGAVIQMGNNAIDGKPIFEGVGKAMLTGAVSGAVGGFLGAGVGALTSGITSTGVRIAVGTTLDAGVGLVAGGVGELAGGASLTQVLEGFKPDKLLETLSSPDQLIGMAMSIAAHKSVPHGSQVHVEGAETPKLNFMERTQQKYAGVGEKFAFKAADVTGLKTANVRTNVNPEMHGENQRVSGFEQAKTRLEISADAHPNDIKVHQEVAKQVRSDNSGLNQIKEKVFGSNRETPLNSRKYELELETQKHEKMAAWREKEALKLPEGSPERSKLLSDAAELRNQASEYKRQANEIDVNLKSGTGVIEHPDFPNLSKEEYKAFESRIKAAEANNDVSAAQQARHERYMQNKRNGSIPETQIKGFDEWLPGAERAQANQRAGSINEDAALNQIGLDNNNSVKTRDGQGRKIVQEEVTLDKGQLSERDVEVRPDGVTENHMLDVKHIDADAKIKTYYYDDQLKGQKQLADQTPRVDGTDSKRLGVILSSESPNVAPSGPLARNADVFLRNPRTGEWSAWDPQANSKKGGWVKVSPEDVAQTVGKSTNELTLESQSFKPQEQPGELGHDGMLDAVKFQQEIERTSQLIDQKLAASPDSPQKQRALALLAQIEKLDFVTPRDEAIFYSGRYQDKSNHERAMEYLGQNPNAKAVDKTLGGEFLLAQGNLYEVLGPELADAVWMKASQMYAKNTSGKVTLFVQGASPERVFHKIEKPILECCPEVDQVHLRRLLEDS